MDNKTLVMETEALKSNIKVLKELVNTEIIAVLKGDGYGFGAVDMASVLKEEGIGFFAVSEACEAFSLREAGFLDEMILLLTPVYEENIIANLIENNIILTAASYEGAKKYALCAAKLNRIAKLHIKIETGFGRFGFSDDEKEEIIKTVKLDNLNVSGIYSHFSNSFEKGDKTTKAQLQVFLKMVDYLESFSINIPMKHIANSCAALRFDETRLSAVRLGSALIGRLPIPNAYGLKRCGFLESRVISVKTLPPGSNVGYANTYKTKMLTDIAVVPVGYKDGFMVGKSNDTFRIIDILRYMFNDLKTLFNENYVTINEKKYRIIGRVGMYNIILDVTGAGVKPGDRAVLQVNPLLIDSKIRREFR